MFLFPLDLAHKGWKIDVDAIAVGKLGVSDRGGDHGHCVGADRNSISATGFTFIIQLGHKTSNLGVHSDAWQNCGLVVPIEISTPGTKDAPSIEGNLTWTDDKKINLPKDTAISYDIALEMFNHRTYEMTGISREPFGVVDTQRLPGAVIFRPKPPSDF